jgi:hypothetical protein
MLDRMGTPGESMELDGTKQYGQLMKINDNS